jgi:hypothetical protein
MWHQVIFCFVLSHFWLANAFAPFPTGCRVSHATELKMAKRKPSAAEQRKRRSKKLQPLQRDTPRSNLDFKTVANPGATPTSSAGETTTTPGLDASQKITDPKVAEQRAQQLMQAQRVSVNMLTRVRERVEALPKGMIQSALEGKGYFVVEDFLKDKEILDSLHQEGTSMLAKMELDMNNLGSGEYIASVKGGEAQYTQCPRTVELVVSTTKHTPPHMGEDSLDTSACMATLRTFDRKAFKASLALLTGNDDDSVVEEVKRPFGVVATEANDQRKVSLIYYIVSESWDEECGGGVCFESDGSKVEAKRDRLVILKSDTCSFRRQPWKGSDDGNMTGSCMELHLVKKAAE